LQRLKENDLFIKSEKYFFSIMEVVFLDMMVSVDEIKIMTIKSRLS